MNIKERSAKFELLDRIKLNNSISDQIISPLIKQKVVYLKENRVRIKVKCNSCIYCGFKFNKTVNFCTNCGKNFVLTQISIDIYENFLNYEFMINLIDKNLENAEKLLIYEKKFDNLPPDFVFPKMESMSLLVAIIRILQVTRLIQRIFQPEVITHYSIGQIHEAVYKNEDMWGKKLKHPWGFYKFQTTKFPEEFDNEADESRTDVTISYKDALPSFDYEGYFLIPSNEVNWSEIDFNKPEIAVLGYQNIIENKISAFATKLRDGACVFKIYLLGSKRIKIIH